MNKFIITNAGKALQTKLLDGATAIFTKIVTTDQVYTEKEAVGLSNFENVCQTSPVTEINLIDDTTVEVTAVIDNSKLEQGYTVNALGLYAKENAWDEILFAVSILGESADQLVAASQGMMSSVTYKMQIVVANASNISIEVSSGVYASEENLRKHEKSVIAQENGIHGVRFADGKLQVQTAEKWEDALPEVKNTNDVTEEGYPLDARQANPNIPGTIAAKIGVKVVVTDDDTTPPSDHSVLWIHG